MKESEWSSKALSQYSWQLRAVTTLGQSNAVSTVYFTQTEPGSTRLPHSFAAAWRECPPGAQLKETHQTHGLSIETADEKCP